MGALFFGIKCVTYRLKTTYLMKLFFSLFTIFILADSCKAPKQAIENSEKQIETSSVSNRQTMTDKQKAVANRDDLVVIYQASSRGFAKYVSVSEKVVQVSSDRSLQKMESFDCETEDWQELKKMVENMNPDDLKGLKAPSDKHTFDGAAGASLTITQGDLAYITPTFDDGNPPAEIEKLVNKVLAIGAKVKKQ